MLGEQLPAEVVEPQLALSLAYAATTGGRPDRVPHWLDLATTGSARTPSSTGGTTPAPPHW